MKTGIVSEGMGINRHGRKTHIEIMCCWRRHCMGQLFFSSSEKYSTNALN
jgi:hypothetical protein